MLVTNAYPQKTFTRKIYSLASEPYVLLLKYNIKVTLRSAIVVGSKPLQIPSLFTIIDLFHNPLTISLNIPIFKDHDIDSYVCVFYLDLDVSDILQGNFNKNLKTSLKFHKEKFSLLQKIIAMKDLEIANLRYSELFSFMKNQSCKKIRRFTYPLESPKELELLKRLIFSNNKIKQINVKKESIVPETDIILGKTLSNKDIGVNSHVLFLTGKKDYRREIIKRILKYITDQEEYHTIIFDFGLNLLMDKTFYRQFLFNDICLDPFSFSDHFTKNQEKILTSHLGFIAKNILRLNDRQIVILEEKISSYFAIDSKYSLLSFLGFLTNEASDDLLNKPQGNVSFAMDASTGNDYTTLLKNAQSPVKSNDLETVVTKIKFLTFLLDNSKSDSIFEMLKKNHLDIFVINTTPDQKALFFYLFNLFYTLNEQQFKNFKFFFLEIDSLLFDNFNDLDISWVHPNLRNSLFDSSEIFSVKKIFNQLETRIYTSFISNAPYSLLSQSTKENIDKLQFMHNFSLIESPNLQRVEFFKIIEKSDEFQFELPDIGVFKTLIPLIFNSEIQFSFETLFCLYDINRNILHQLLHENYLMRTKSLFMITENSTKLKKIIIDYLAYQPNPNNEENEFLVRISNQIEYNIFRQNEFLFKENIELICTRLLAMELKNSQKIDYFLLFQFLRFKQKLIDEKQLGYYLVLSMQYQPLDQNILLKQASQSTVMVHQDPNANSIKDYLVEVKSTLEETDLNQQKPELGHLETYIQSKSKVEVLSELMIDKNNLSYNEYPPNIKEIIDIINLKIHKELTDPKIKFPERPVFLIMKFLEKNTTDVLIDDLYRLNGITTDVCRLEV